MRKVNLLVIHCSDSDIPAHDNVETIRKWHTERGFTGPDGVEGNEDDIGYHYFIRKDGTVCPGRGEEYIGAHVRGHNSRSLGVCLSGRNSFTPEQFASLRELVFDITARHDLSIEQIKGHRDLDSGKTCPNFEVKNLLRSWGL